MTVRMSLTTKTTIVLLVMVFIVSVVISTFLINVAEQDLIERQRVTQIKNQGRLQILEEVIRNRTVVWIDLVNQARFIENESYNREALLLSLNNAKDYLALNIQLDQIWLFDAQNTVPKGVKGAALYALVETTRESLDSKAMVLCDDTCFHYIAIPVMAEESEIPVVVVSTSMRELLSLYYLTTEAFRVALVQTNSEPLSFQLSSRLTQENTHLLNSILASLPSQTTESLLVEHGQRVTVNDQVFLVSLIPFTHMVGDHPYVLVVQDVSDAIDKKQQYELGVMVSAVVLFLIFALLLNLYLRPYRERLLAVSQRLPLLAERKFRAFHQRVSTANKSRMFHLSDELDVVEDVATKLAKELEEIDNKMATTTARLEKLAMFDVLTGLPNRNMLTFQIEKELAGLNNHDSHLVALLFMDLDDFKKVNDSFGHDIGDKLLKAAAIRISRSIKDIDVASRFGGDEFVVLLREISNRKQVENIASRIVNVFNQPLDIGEHRFYLSISIGVAISRRSRATHIEMLRHADIAMYEAKAKKGAGYSIYDSTMNQKVMKKVELEAEARIALREHQFSLALQPQVDIKTQKLIGFEALLRWYHPQKGAIPPGDFIPALENTAFMLELDYWVLNKSARFIKKFNDHGLLDMKVSINLSAEQFLDPNLPELLKEQIIKNAIAPSQVCLELTETVLVSDVARATKVMKNVREMGCLLAIDDFGTGYSSLSYLKSLPADYIKIDQSFIASMIESESDRNIVQSTISMVRKLGLNVVAEGIETSTQLALLKDYHCHIGQGYFLSRPIPEADIWQVLEVKLKDGKWQFSEA